MEDKLAKIPSKTEGYFYNAHAPSLLEFERGDEVNVTFKDESYRVKKEYRGKTLKFVVNNYQEWPERWGPPQRTLALVPFEKKDTFKKADVLMLTSSGRMEGLMIDLYPCNRRPFYGWKNKTVKLEKVKRGCCKIRK